MKDAERTNRDTPAALDAIPERYWRNARFLSRTDQEKLLQAHVVIIGLGGLGGTVLEELLRLGIGTITGVDMDVFELSNLNRQLLATEENIGLHKAEAAPVGLCKALFGQDVLIDVYPWHAIDPILFALPLSAITIVLVSLATQKKVF